MPNGVICAGAVDGSNHVGAIVTCQAMTDSPVWASAAPERTTQSSVTTRMNETTCRAARAIGSSLFGELGRTPPERRAQAFLLADLVELHPDVGPRRIEWRQHVEPGTDRIAEARRVGAAVDRQLGSGQRFG